jgi:hypothetical protein
VGRVARKPKGYWTEVLGITPKEDSIEYQRRWRAANPGSFKEWKYGVTQEEYLLLLKEQDFKCAICKTEEPGGRHSNWHIDHNHNTDVVRGLLCHNCNRGLGFFKDDPYFLDNAINYLCNTKEKAR